MGNCDSLCLNRHRPFHVNKNDPTPNCLTASGECMHCDTNKVNQYDIEIPNPEILCHITKGSTHDE